MDDSPRKLIVFPVKFKANNSNFKKRCETYSNSTIKTPERRFGAFNVNFEHISHLF